jgi:hypothetical protein
MNERLLQQMYQQWQQGNEQYAKDWSIFVLKVAENYQTTGDEVMRMLQKYHWFEWHTEQEK